MNATATLVASGEVRRIEEYSLNASGAFQSLIYDGWLLGWRPGPTKRLRCVNPLYSSSLPLAAKVAYCAQFYRDAGLPPLFRLLPISQPAGLDAHLERAGWGRFEPTLVQLVDLARLRTPTLPAHVVEIVTVPAWVEATAALFDLGAVELRAARERAQRYPLPQAGALIRRDGEVVAGGLVKMENDAAGLFALVTAPALRGQGRGRVLVAALVAEAARRGARRAYLQVTASNVAATTLYQHFGFVTAYDYWYRGLAEHR